MHIAWVFSTMFELPGRNSRPLVLCLLKVKDSSLFNIKVVVFWGFIFRSNIQSPTKPHIGKAKSQCICMNECHGVSKQLFFEVEKSPRKRSFTEKRGNKCEEIISPQCAKHIKSNVNGWPMFVLLRERTM